MKKIITASLLSTIILFGCTSTQNELALNPNEQVAKDIPKTEYNLPKATKFDTEISGYYYSRPEIILEQDYNVAYLLVTNFRDTEFKEEIETRWDSYGNEPILGLYPFQIGCIVNGQIESATKIDSNTKEAILKSTKENPVSVLLIDRNPGTDKPCDSLVQEIKLK